MGNFTFEKTCIDGLMRIDSRVFGDERGYFMETYQQKDFAQNGISSRFVQDNQSKSRKGVLRGLHFQPNHPQAKLLRVLSGAVFDVAVDIRPGSPTFRKWFGAVLSEENHCQLFLPKGLAHGFLVLSEEAVFAYKCDEFYHPDDEGGILWSDPAIGIAWPQLDCPLTVNARDSAFPTLQQWIDLNPSL